MPSNVYVVTRYPLDNPDFTSVVRVFDASRKACSFIMGTPDFEKWHPDFNRIAYCGKEMYEYMEYAVE